MKWLWLMSKALRSRLGTSEERAKASARKKRYLDANPDAREKFAEAGARGRVEMWKKPGARERNREQLLQANVGRPKSEEHRAKISASRKAYFARLREERADAKTSD